MAPAGGPNAKPPGMNSIVQQIIDEQKQQKVDLRKSMERKPRSTKLPPILAGVLLLGNVVAWVIIPPSNKSSGDRRNGLEVERDLRLVVASAASEVDIWRRLHENRMPATLAEVGVSDGGLVLVKVDDQVYEIRGTDHGVKLAYRSNTPITDFMDAGIPVKK